MPPPSQPFKDAFQKALVPSAEIHQGDIFAVGDDPKNPIIKFPEDNLEQEGKPKQPRTFHKQRYVLVIQDDKANSNIAFPYVLISPLTHDARETEYTVKIPTEFLAQHIPGDSYALVHLSQPILKIFLKEHAGHVEVNSKEFETIRATYLRLIGII